MRADLHCPNLFSFRTYPQRLPLFLVSNFLLLHLLRLQNHRKCTRPALRDPSHFRGILGQLQQRSDVGNGCGHRTLVLQLLDSEFELGNLSEQGLAFGGPARLFSQPSLLFSEPALFFSEPPSLFSLPIGR